VNWIVRGHQGRIHGHSTAVTISSGDSPVVDSIGSFTPTIVSAFESTRVRRMLAQAPTLPAVRRRHEKRPQRRLTKPDLHPA